jgi:FeS assembly SUF system protein
MSPIMNLDTSRLAPKDPENANPPAEKPSVPTEPLNWEQIEDLKKAVIAALCTCFDPEIPVNIYELGLIYDLVVEETGAVQVKMTLTSPACPVAGSLPGDVQRKIEAIPQVSSAKVEVVWDPPWDKSRMSEAAKLQLGIDDF